MHKHHSPARISRRSPVGTALALALTGLSLFTACSGAGTASGSDRSGPGTPETDPPETRPVAVAPVALEQPLDAPGSKTRAAIERAIEAVRADSSDTDALTTLGLGYYQLARETADPSNYGRAEEAFDRVLAIHPRDPEALIGKGTVALARHDFAGALELGREATEVAPSTSRAWGVVGDALIELGRYDEAVEAIQTMVDLRPDLGSYGRVSYARELYGRLDGAIDAMEQAVIAGGPSSENTEYLRVALGNLWFLAGDLDHAESAYQASLARLPGYVFALAGQARVEAARGRLEPSIDLLQQATQAVPSPELLIALGEAQEAAGHLPDADVTYQLVRQIEELYRANGVATDLDMALFEADHGDPATALELARAAYQATPNVKAADALAWSLYRNGELEDARQHAEEALRLGSLEPSYRYHAGVIAAAQGDVEQAQAWLTESLERNSTWSPLHAPRAQDALDGLDR
jgi:tetratricopeptide (TPR) repeat protein